MRKIPIILAVLFVVILSSGCVQTLPEFPNQTVNITPSDLKIIPVSGGECTVGEFCNVQIAQANGGEPPYTFTADSYATGTTPMGVVIGMDGLLSGTPSKEGDYDFGVCVKDMTGTSKCTQTSVTVNPKAEAPAVCGNDKCEAGESKDSCCIDCGCKEGYECKEGKCIGKEIEPSAVVKSATCSLVSKKQLTGCTNHPNGVCPVIEYIFRLTASGTVTGSVGTRISVGSAPDDSGEYGTYLSEETTSFTTDSWTSTGKSTGYSSTQYRYSRGQGDPETTTWHLDGGDYTILNNPEIEPAFNGDSVRFTIFVDYYSSTSNFYRPVTSSWTTCSG